MSDTTMSNIVDFANIYHGKPTYDPDFDPYIDATMERLNELKDLPGTQWITYYSDAKEQIEEILEGLPQQVREDIQDLYSDENCDDDYVMKFVVNSEGHVFVITVDVTDENCDPLFE